MGSWRWAGHATTAPVRTVEVPLGWIPVVCLPALTLCFALSRYSLDHTGLYVCDRLHSSLNTLLQGLPHSLVMENDSHELLVMVALHPLRRSLVRSCPFSKHVTQLRGEESWAASTQTRMYAA